MLFKNLLLCAWSVTIYAEPPKMITVDDSSNGHQVVLHAGEVLKISLSQNASTGYTWAVHAKPAILQESEGESADPPKGPPGSPGVRYFYFEAAGQGSGELELEYRRSWEQSPQPARTFKLLVRVE